MKKLFLSVAVILAVAVLGVWFYADAVATRAVERGSNQAFGTETDVGLVTLGFVNASVGVRGYRVSGPEGFEETSLFRVDETDLKVGYGGIGRERVEAARLRVRGVELNLLMQGNRSNFGPVLRHLRGLSGGAGGGSQDAPRFVIREVVLEDIAVNVNVPGVRRELELPTIELRDVGGEDGVWLSELAAIVMGAVIQEAARHGDVPPVLQAALGDGLGNLPASLARQAREDAREQLEEEAEGLLDRALEKLGDDGDG